MNYLFSLLVVAAAYSGPATQYMSNNKVPGALLFCSADTATLAGNWILQPVLPSDTATGKLPSIRFDLEKGHFSGFTGCNQMNGSFVKKGDQLSFNTDLVMTRIECKRYNEKEFVTNLLRVTEYKIQQGVLTLMIGKTPISKWIRENTVTAPVAVAGLFR